MGFRAPHASNNPHRVANLRFSSSAEIRQHSLVHGQRVQHTKRVLFVSDIDYDFITLAMRDDAGPGNISRTIDSPAEQLHFLNDCFSILSLACEQCGA